MIFSIILISIACLVFAYNLNSIGNILKDAYSREEKYNYNLRILNRFMNKKNITSNLKLRIKQYLDFIWKEEQIEDEEEEMNAINHLSSILKEELFFQSNAHITQNIPILYKNFSAEFLEKLTAKFKQIRKIPGEIIFKVYVFIK